MTEQHAHRCPACDAANPAEAAFCTRCGKSMGGEAIVGSVEMSARTDIAALDSRVRPYVIGAVVVAVVLVVGGAMFLLVDVDERDGVASADPSDSVTAMPITPDSTTVKTTIATTIATTTVPLVPTVAVTAAPITPTTPAPTPPPATVAPTPPPAPPPVTAAPSPAPVATSTLSFAQADDFYRNYIATAINGDYTAAWNMLSSSDQRDYTEGFDQFVGFWRSVSFAEVQRIESVGGSVGFQSLAVEMAYGQADGDPTSLEIIEVDVNVRPDGSFQIFDYRYIGNQ